MSAPAVLGVRSRARAAATTSPSRSLANKRTRLASLVRTELENSTTTHLPRNSIDEGGPGVAAVPDVPRKGHAGVSLTARPLRPMHHGKSFAKTANPRRTAVLENVAPPLALIKREPHKHHDEWADLDGVRGELLSQLVRRVGDDGPTSGRQLFHDEIAPVDRIPVIDEIRREDLMAGGPQRAHDRTATARRPPKAMWQVLDSEQRLNGNGRSFVEVVAALGERMALDLARMI